MFQYQLKIDGQMAQSASIDKLQQEWISGQRWILFSPLLMIICTLSIAVVLGKSWEERLALDRPAILLQGAGPKEMPVLEGAKGTQVYQRIRESGGTVSADYGFLNFNNDPLSVNFSVASRELAVYKHDYGYTRSERAAIDTWQKDALDDAYQYAVKHQQSQEQLNKASERITADYKEKVSGFFRSRGFKVLEGNLLVVDLPEIARRNVKKLRSIAVSINNSGEKLGYDSDSVIAAALSLVQTALRYENVPVEIAGRQTGGLLPPLEAITSGKGDCDTKVALLASILLNWNRIKIVGVGVPGHYLMGVLRNPAKGDAFVDYKGLHYVLIEPAGPGWLPPGSIDKKTAALLNANSRIRIEPITAN
jgi:hypothetical protein